MEVIDTHTDKYSANYLLENLGYKKTGKNATCLDVIHRKGAML